MPSNAEDFSVVRLPVDEFKWAANLAKEIGVSATWVIQRAVSEMRGLIEAERAKRFVPRLAKMVDGLRVPDLVLPDSPSRGEEKSAPAPREGKRGALRVGQG